MAQRLETIAHLLDSWAPSWSAWERDTVGIQIGSGSQGVRRILVALDVTEAVVAEAVRGSYDLIVSHHPLLFRMPRTITDTTETGRMILSLARHQVAVISAHTNLDAARGGVSWSLAEALGLGSIRFLAPLTGTVAKIAVFVPVGHEERIRTAMTEAGAGTIGQYTGCSFTTEGTGTFTASAEASPVIGTPGGSESVRESRLEMIAPRAKVASIVRAVRQVHPYEEMAYDVVELQNPDPTAGMGAVGELKRPVQVRRFLGTIKRSLKAAGVRYAGVPAALVRTVAVCGGSGGSHLEDAVRAGADLFLTADLSYHTFQAAAGRLCLVDAGHYETESVVLKPLAAFLRSRAGTRSAPIHVAITKHVTNPIHWA